MIKRILFIIIILAQIANGYAQASPEDIVKSFGEALSSWCQTGNIAYREKIDKLCSGVKKCRVEDKIHAEYQAKRGLINYETFILHSYLNMFQSLRKQGIEYKISNVQFCTSDKMPDGLLSFVTANITISGAINSQVKDLFLIRDGKITGIYEYSSELGFSHLYGSLIEALRIGRYKSTMGFFNGYAQVQNEVGKDGLIDIKGNVIIPCIWEKLIYGQILEKDEYSPFAWSMDNKNRTRSIDLRNPNKYVPFATIGCYGTHDLSYPTFKNGWACVGKRIDDNFNYKYGYLHIDDTDYKKVQYIYDYANSFSEGYAYVRIGKKHMIINQNFKVILQTNEDDDYHIIGDVNDGLVPIVSKGWKNLKFKYGFMDLKGNVVIPCIYNHVEKFSNGICRVTLHPNKPGNYLLKCGCIDKEGKIVIPFEFDDIYGNVYHQDYILMHKLCNKKIITYIFDNNGKVLQGFSPNGYENITQRTFRDGLLAFEQGDLMGYLNKRGEIVVPPIYSWVRPFINGFGCVKQNNKYGAVNTSGILVIPCIYDKDFFFDNGIALVQKDGKIGLIDRYGNSTFLSK